MAGVTKKGDRILRKTLAYVVVKIALSEFEAEPTYFRPNTELFEVAQLPLQNCRYTGDDIGKT